MMTLSKVPVPHTSVSRVGLGLSSSLLDRSFIRGGPAGHPGAGFLFRLGLKRRSLQKREGTTSVVP
jgi:hypothetical protein